MKHPTKDECIKLLKEYSTPEHVQGHCRAVAATACIIGQALNEKGFHLNVDLIRAAGLLHDIARVEDRHWDVGADLMAELGYDEEGRIIRRHMMYSPFSDIKKVSEMDLVCLGDRIVMEDKYVGLDRRIDYVIRKAEKSGHPEARPYILEKKEDGRRFIEQIEDTIGMSLDELMEQNHIKKLVEF